MAKTIRSDFPEMTLDFASHLKELGRLRCPFGHRQEGSLQIMLSGKDTKLEPKYEPFPFRPPILKARAS